MESRCAKWITCWHMKLYSLFEKCPNTENKQINIGQNQQKLSQKFKPNQWKNSDVVIEWFKQIKNKNLP